MMSGRGRQSSFDKQPRTHQIPTLLQQMNSRMAAHVNAHQRHVQFQIKDSVLLSTQNLRLPVGTTRAKKFSSRWIGPFSVVDRIADGRAYRLDLPSHMHLHPSFLVSLLKPYVHDTQSSCIRPAPIPDLFADCYGAEHPRGGFYALGILVCI
jgi:hypothetical protein